MGGGKDPRDRSVPSLPLPLPLPLSLSPGVPSKKARCRYSSVSASKHCTTRGGTWYSSALRWEHSVMSKNMSLALALPLISARKSSATSIPASFFKYPGCFSSA